MRPTHSIEADDEHALGVGCTCAQRLEMQDTFRGAPPYFDYDDLDVPEYLAAARKGPSALADYWIDLGIPARRSDGRPCCTESIPQRLTPDGWVPTYEPGKRARERRARQRPIVVVQLIISAPVATERMAS